MEQKGSQKIINLKSKKQTPRDVCFFALKLLNPDNQVICTKGRGLFNVLRHFEDNRKVYFFLFFILTAL